MSILKKLLLSALNQPAPPSTAMALRSSSAAPLSPYREPQQYAHPRLEIIVPCVCAKHRKVFALAFDRLPSGLFRYTGSIREMVDGTVQGAAFSLRSDQVESPRAAYACAWCNASGPDGFGVLFCHSCGALHCFGKRDGKGWLCPCGRNDPIRNDRMLPVLQGYRVTAQVQALRRQAPDAFAPPDFYDLMQTPPPASSRPRRKKIIVTERITRREG